jgi:IK cytokine
VAAAETAAEAAASTQPVRFETAAGRALYNAVFRPPPHNRTLVREMFQPCRTAFVWEDAEEGGGAGDVPTTLRRSKADCPPVEVRALHACGVAAVAAAAPGGRLSPQNV